MRSLKNNAIEYDPKVIDMYEYGVSCDGAAIKTNPSPILSQEQLTNVDALYHWFDWSQCDGFATRQPIEQPDDPHRLMAQSILRGIWPMNDTLDRVQYDKEPQWQDVRALTSFFAGQAFNPEVITWLKYLIKNPAIFIDGSILDQKSSADSDDENPLKELLWISDNMKSIIEEGICELYANDARKVIDFINASPTDVIDKETKWVMEGRWIAERFTNIRAFNDNFNTLFITGAHKFITADQLNLNKIYRLFAKLGRINTRIVFVG